MRGSLIILAVDNAIVESCIYKGNSSSPKLFQLILRFKQLELHSGARFIVSHVSGNRMRSQDTDGVSRGNLNEGVSLGESMLSFCLWHLGALKRNKHLKDWLIGLVGKDADFLQPEDWFVRGHDITGGSKHGGTFWMSNTKKGTFIWSPPPAADATCVEELRKARIKQQESTHIVIIPRLMTPLWLKQLYKTADLIFQIRPQT